MIIPVEVVVSATNAGGVTVFDTCANIFNSSVALTWTIGTDADGYTTAKIIGIFPEAMNTGQFGVKIGLFDNLAVTGNTGTFKIEIYSVNDKSIAGKNIDTPVTIVDPVTTYDSNCLTCSWTATSWDTCNVPSDNPFLQGTKCVFACSNGYYLSDKACYLCHHSCSICAGPKSNECISWYTNFFLWKWILSYWMWKKYSS